jgi:WD40 repeat protein/serine/threonine protein kinase
MLEPGELVENFKIVRLVGRGGMGEVYLARDMRLGRKVALKVVHRSALGDETAILRFFQEAKVTARFNHPHIVTIYGVGEHDGQPYVALEYLEGQTLRERLEGGRPGVRETLRVGLAIAEALAEAHSHGILHRDLKPGNIVLPKDGRLRVVDFGLAKSVQAVRSADSGSFAQIDPEDSGAMALSQLLTMRSGISGTPPYMSPEQWEGEDVEGATDIWALGVLLYELLCGMRPFRATSIHILGSAICSDEPSPTIPEQYEVPAELADLVHACLSKRADERPDAAEVVRVLRGLVSPRDRSAGSEASPFRGLLPFTERHTDLFFGRDDEIGAFIERLREEPVLPVLGPSGAGKSSFVQAGVIPRLREQGRWRVIGLRPGRRPFESLRMRLVSGSGGRRTGEAVTRRTSGSGSLDSQIQTIDVEDVKALIGGASLSSSSAPVADWEDSGSSLDAERFQQTLVESPAKLAVYLQQLAELEETRVLLFVDQLEELYTLNDDDEVRRGFMDAVCSAADDPNGPVRVIFTLRDDFLVRLAETPGARQALGHITVLRSPDADALHEILSRPLERSGYRYEDHGMVREMVQAVGGEIACLPLLQFACSRLWENRDRKAKVIPRDAYREMGGVEGALARHADGVLEGMTPDQLQTAQRILLRLVTPEGTRAVVTRSQLLEAVGDGAEDVLDRLIRGRALMVRKSEEPGGGALVELVHESLVGSWDRLRRWIDAGREELSFLAEVNQAAELWEKRGRRVEEVWSGDALGDGLRRAERLAAVPDLVREFLDAGASLARRRQRNKRIVLAVVILLLAAISVVLALQNREARQQRGLAEDRRRLAEEKRAEALREGAGAALVRGDLIETRAKLRGSFEIQDSPLSRALLWKLSKDPLEWRKQLGGYLYQIAFSPDGRAVAAAGSSGSVHLLDLQTQGLRVLRGAGDQILDLSFAADGSSIAAAVIDGSVAVWDLADGAIRSWNAGAGAARGVAFSPDGRLLVTAGEDKIVRLWESRSGKSWAVLEGHSGKVRDVAFSPDGKTVASAGYEGSIILWDARTNTQKRVLEGHEGRVSAVEFGPDGRTVASASADGTLRLWSVETGETSKVLSGHADGIHSLAFGPTGDRLVSGSEDRTLRIWNLEQGAASAVLEGHDAAVRGVAFGPEGRLVASAGLDGAVRVWRASAVVERGARKPHVGGVLSLAVTPDGQLLATGGADKTIKLWDVSSGRSRGVLAGHEQGVMGVAFGPDGKILASASSDASVRVWDVGEARQRSVLRGHTQELWDVAVGPGGRQLASGGIDNTARLWDLESGEGTVLGNFEAFVYCTAFSPDGELIAIGGADNLIRVRELESGEVSNLEGHTSAPMGVVFSSDGRSLASGGWDGTVRIWDLASGEGRVIARSDAWVWGIDLSPDGRRIGAALSDGTARIWDLQTAERVLLRGHRSDVNDFRFAADGQLAVTAGDDGTLRVWDAATGRPHWRAPLMSSSPVRVYTHRGWAALEAGASAAEPPGAGWRRAVEQRARLAAVTTDRRTACLAAFDGAVEVWSVKDDRALSEVEIDDVTELLATPRGCVALARDELHVVGPDGASTRLASGVTAIARDRGEILAAVGSEVRVFDAEGEAGARFEVDPGATALARIERWLVVGYREGDLALYPLDDSADRPSYSFEEVPSSPVVRLLAGPMGTVIIGFADGTLGIWKLDNGSLLERMQYHGAVIHMALVDKTLYAATELGEVAVLDLGIFHDDYCDLLEQVWQDVPVIWENGLPIHRDPPGDHRCRRSPGELL